MDVVLREVFRRATHYLDTIKDVLDDKNTKWSVLAYECHHMKDGTQILDALFTNKEDKRILILVAKLVLPEPIKDKFCFRVNYYDKEMFTDFFINNNKEYGNISKDETMEFIDQVLI
jgi:hypothetical protein